MFRLGQACYQTVTDLILVMKETQIVGFFTMQELFVVQEYQWVRPGDNVKHIPQVK